MFSLISTTRTLNFELVVLIVIQNKCGDEGLVMNSLSYHVAIVISRQFYHTVHTKVYSVFYPRSLPSHVTTF